MSLKQSDEREPRSGQSTQIVTPSVPTIVMKSATEATEVDSSPAVFDPASDLGHTDDDDAGSRYELRTTLGEGGMGEVLLCRDHRIGREVAMKLVLDSHRGREKTSSHLDERFLREARVQGQLEHPAIVPVYDLGKDSSGRSFFTMKRVRGETLEILLSRLARGDERTLAEYTRHKLLAAYARVCLAVHFAHSRGVVHRDLKPANVMLGDFGEVYVLDWGVAKINTDDDDDDRETVVDDSEVDQSGERRTLSPQELISFAEKASSRRHPSTKTEAGTVLGTPAYMAPEQERGARVDARMDVYSLGAILFEILTFKSLHDERASTLVEREQQPQQQQPQQHETPLPLSRLSLSPSPTDIPPELNAIWRKATERNPANRTPSARDLHDAIERFLSGDRDVAARKTLAAEHLRAASELIQRGSGTPINNRSRALAEVGRAIALVPDDGDALSLLVDLLSMPAKEAPPEVLLELERAAQESRRAGLRRAVVLYTLPALGFFLPAMMLMGVKNLLSGILCIGSFLAAGAVAAGAHYKNGLLTKHGPWVTVASSAAMATSVVISGVYVLLPTFVAVNTVCHAIAGRRSHRTQIIALGVLALLIPTMLEMFGLIPSSHSFVNGSLVVTSRVFELKEPFTPIFFVFINVALVVFSSMFVGEYRDALNRAQLRHLSQLWLLRQLVPERAREATAGDDSPSDQEPPSRCSVDW